MRPKLDSSELQKDPVAFTEAILRMPDGSPARPHSGQVEILRGVKPTTIISAGRQWGKSVVLGWYVIWFIVTHPGREVLIIAPTLDQARIIYNEIARQFRSGPLSRLIKGKIKEYPFPQLEIHNGSKVICRGANSPQYIRGHSPHLIIIDEAAFVKDKVITDVVEPLMTVTSMAEDSALIEISTPFGIGEFQRQYQYAKNDTTGTHAAYHFTSLDNPYANQKRLEEFRDRYGETSLIWQTEYLAEFVDSDMAVFSWADIKAALDSYPYGDEFPVHAQPDHRYVQGVDLANLRDYYVSTILDISNPAFCTLVHMDRQQRKGWASNKQVTRTNYKLYNRARTLIDSTTMGESIVEDLRDIGAEGYSTSSSAAKYEAVQELVRMFNEHRIGLPNDRQIIDELRYFAYEITPSKNIRMEAKHGHDDIVMSLAYASILAARPTLTGFFKGVNLIRTKASKLLPAVDPWTELSKREP